MEHLFDRLKEYSESDMYPYHMPGHKRQGWGELASSICSLDITEIDGFDNLHDARDILKNLQTYASRVYNADESFYLINGSTGGVLSAISSAVPDGGRILMSRNCHKSAYHAAYLRRLRISYLYPSYIEGFRIFEAITPEQVQQALKQYADVRAVFIVSPTYEGRIADVKAIADIVHAKGIPLIVDEAHGAHLGFAKGFAPNSCQCGADLVIHSVHKTLPALTQTALLHVNGDLIDRDKLRRFLQIYQSTSPSYLLMGSIDNALRYLDLRGQAVFQMFCENWSEMMQKLQFCKHLKFLPMDDVRQDIGKLVISVKGTNRTGKQIYDLLRDKYHIQLEMAAEDYALAMFTINDKKEGYTRMLHALLEIDEGLECIAEDVQQKNCLVEGREELPLAEAWDAPSEKVRLEAAVGRCSAGFVNLYPPGIPLLVPGERITENLCQQICQVFARGLNVQGVSVTEGPEEKNTLYVSVLRQ